MALQIAEGSLQILTAVFAARYTEGFRYLDRCGETIIRVREVQPALDIKQVTQRAAIFLDQEKRQTVSFGVDQFDVSVQIPLALKDAQAALGDLCGTVEALYGVVVKSLGSPKTSRVGARFSFLAPSDSLEEADRFVCKAVPIPFAPLIPELKNLKHIDSILNFVLQDDESGARLKLNLSSLITQQAPGTPVYEGFEYGVKSGGGVLLDLDFFTRPESGHYDKARVFIQDSFERSKNVTRAILKWLVQS